MRWCQGEGRLIRGGIVKCLMQQLLTGLCYCHEQGVIHRYLLLYVDIVNVRVWIIRDLKLSNLLLTSNGILKIGIS